MIEHFKKYYVKYIMSLIIGSGIIILNCILSASWTSMLVYLNGFFVAGFSLVCVGGLSWCSQMGAYDVFSYMFAKRGANGVKPSLYEYSEIKKEKRSKYRLGFLPYIISGAFFVIICMILFMFY